MMLPSRPYVLYIEDDYEDVELLQYVLQGSELNISIVNARNGEEGLAFLEQAKIDSQLPEMIFLDINMPKLNGKETLALLKADRQLGRIPVIIVSTSTLNLDRNYFKSQNVPYIVKPGDIRLYKKEIISALQAHTQPANKRHQCIIYTGSPSQKLTTLAQTMQRMMRSGYRCLYINSADMVAAMQKCISDLDTSVEEAVAEGKLVFSSAPVCVDGVFDVDIMLQGLEKDLDDALEDGNKGLWASGDMTWELGSEKNYEKLLEYEWKLERLFERRKELQGICQYHYESLPADVVRKGLLMHGTVYINETSTWINPHHCTSALPVEGATANPLLHELLAEICKVGN